jgi:predicted transposase YdaD
MSPPRLKKPANANRDAFFKVMLSHPVMAQSFVEAYLPADLIAAIDTDSIQQLPTELESTTDASLRADILLLCRLRTESGQFLVIAVEHQSRAQYNMDIRCVIYGLRKMESLKREHPEAVFFVHCVVVHQSANAWPQHLQLVKRLPGNLGALLNNDGSQALFSPGFNLVDLATVAYETFMGEHLIYAPLAVMKLIDDAHPHASMERVFDCLEQHLSHPKDHALLHIILDYLYYNAQRLDSGSTLINMINEIRHPNLHKNSMTWAEAIYTEGWQEGIAKGQKEGVQQGIERGIERGIEQGQELGRLNALQSTVSRLLQRRFGELPPAVEQSLRSASPEQLELLTDQLLDAPSLDALFQDFVKE